MQQDDTHVAESGQWWMRRVILICKSSAAALGWFLKFCSTDSSFHMYSLSLLSSFLAWRQFLTRRWTGTTSCVGIRFPTANSARPQGLVWVKPRKSQAGDLSPRGQEEKKEAKREKPRDDRRQRGVERTGQRLRLLRRADAHLSPPLSRHLSIITPFQHHCISLHHFIAHQITYKPPFIHPSLSIAAIALSLPICSSISLPSGSLQSVCSILFVCARVTYVCLLRY